MRRRTRLITAAAAAVVAAAAALSLSSCATTSNGAATHGCAPEWPKTSDAIVRPGQTVTLAATASLCNPRFTDGRRLTVIAESRGAHRVSLATLQAHSSGAFEQEIRIPADSSAGTLQLFVRGIDVPCSGGASCAAYETSVLVVTSSPDFSRASRPNQVAAGVADRMIAALHDRASVVGLAIAPDGIQVVLATPHRDQEQAVITRVFERAQARAPHSDRAIANSAHLHVTFNQHTGSELERLSTRISRDQAWRNGNRVDVSGWGPDTSTDSVRLHLHHYTDRSARALAKRYGPAITVATTDLSPSAS